MELGITILLIYRNTRGIILGNKHNYQIVVNQGLEKGQIVFNF